MSIKDSGRVQRTIRAGSKRGERDRRIGWKKRVAPLRALVGWVACALIVPASASAEALTLAEVETLVRTQHYEGLPREEVMRIDAEGAARLAEMLADPEESRAHANILLALGQCGEAGALEAIEAWAANPPTGEIDRHAFRAWQALPFALAELADHDPRAVARLEARLSAASPDWTFRSHRGAKLHRLQRRAAATALAQTGLAEAEAALERADARGSDAEFSEHVREARSLFRERRRERLEQRRGAGAPTAGSEVE